MKEKSKQFFAATIAVAILFTLMTIVSAWTPVEPPPYDLEYAESANGIEPFLVEGDMGNFHEAIPGINNFKVDTPEGNYMDADDENPVQLDFYPDDEDASLMISVWLSRDEDSKLYIMKWQSFNVDVHYVITKGGSDFFVYQYDGTMDEDEDLMNPMVGEQLDTMSDLSNFSFYWTPMTEETSAETEETSAETEETSAETEEATELVILEETLPLAEVTTESTTQETIQLTDEEVPQTGQSGSSVIIGSTLLALAASLFYILRRKRSFIE